MIVYENTSAGFISDVKHNKVASKIKEAYFQKTGKTKFADKEGDSWINSTQFMGNVIELANVADDCGVLIEYGLPSTSMRIDFIITGQDEKGNKNFVIVELKQWTEAQSTTQKDLVLTKYYSGRSSTHPSYQASSYKMFLSDYNENVYKNDLKPFSCAFLHNYVEKKPEPLKADIYADIIKDSPIYFQDDQHELQQFIQKYVGKGKGQEILYKIESGNIRPGKKLIDHVVSLFKGNTAFTLIEEQKVAYETALHIALNAKVKTVITINGGPGTGKSVVAMSLMGNLLKHNKNVFFSAPNASFREVMLDKLVQGKDDKRAKFLLAGSGKFFGSKTNMLDVIVVDEAHRLKDGTAFMYKGENQVEDIINASLVSIFFVDEDQMIRPQDIGSMNEIKRIATQHHAQVFSLEMNAQFRCSGADGYVNWVTDVLQIRETANFDGWEGKDFVFEILSTPNELRKTIEDKAAAGFNARILAGYAWPWTQANKGNPNAEINDVSIPEHEFEMPWNSRLIGPKWAIHPKGVEQVGCVHTAQGLEFDYVGVIVGNDLRFNEEKGEFYTDPKEYKDSEGKKGIIENPEEICKLVRNVYRILLTRGMKGCFVYFTDKHTEQYFKTRLKTK